VGELALLGRAHRATVTAQTEVHCLMGGRPAAVRLLGIRGARERVIRLARHRLAADLVPVPLRPRDGATVLAAAGRARRRKCGPGPPWPLL
jgi:hypothetical protein